MKLEEFIERLQTEPRSQDATLLAARRASTEHARAARDADAFEALLEEALRLPVPEGLKDRIIVGGLSHARPRHRAARWRWLAAAAGLVAAFGLAFMLLGPLAQPRLERAFIDHFNYPEPSALTAQQTVAQERVLQALAAIGADANRLLDGRITYFSPCLIGGKRGLHLVIRDSDDRRTTVMFLPDERVRRARSLTAAAVPAYMLGTATGAVALFAHDGQELVSVADALRS